MANRYRSGTGFTLVELVVVTIVLVLMVAVMVPLLIQRQGPLRDAALVKAANGGDWARVTVLLKRGANPDGYSGASPHYCLMCQAISMDRVDMAELVVQREDDDKRRYYLGHGLAQAVTWGNVPVAALVLAHGANPNSPNYGVGGYINLDGEDIVRRSDNPEAWDNRRWWGTHLHVAAKAGNRELVDLLLAHGARACIGLEGDVLPQDTARSAGHDELAAYLDEVGTKELHEAGHAVPRHVDEEFTD